jgi:hypothetical protein
MMFVYDSVSMTPSDHQTHNRKGGTACNDKCKREAPPEKELIESGIHCSRYEKH